MAPIDASSNIPLFDPDECTLRSCPLVEAGIIYIPSLAPNAIYLSVFLVLLIAHALQGVLYRTWDIFGTLVTGLVFEVIGYSARLRMRNDSSDKHALITCVHFPFGKSIEANS
jgi:hypothetical protein